MINNTVKAQITSHYHSKCRTLTARATRDLIVAALPQILNKRSLIFAAFVR